MTYVISNHGYLGGSWTDLGFFFHARETDGFVAIDILVGVHNPGDPMRFVYERQRIGDRYHRVDHVQYVMNRLRAS